VLSAEQKADSAPLENTPPAIISSDVPALLVYIDGDAAYRAVEGTGLQRVINTRPLLLKDAEGSTTCMCSMAGWSLTTSAANTLV
jgi:hypothetical protein